jgi:hypothetical protein
LNLAAVALLRAQRPRAQALMAASEAMVARPNAAYLAPLWMLLQAHIEAGQTGTNRTPVQARVLALLQTQQRRLFDPISGHWIGQMQAPNATERVRKIADQVLAKRATLERKIVHD